jgi:hypothetical protein
MPRSRAPLRAIRDQLHFTTDAEGAHHVRRRWGAGVVVLDFNRETPMSPCGAGGSVPKASWGFPCREMDTEPDQPRCGEGIEAGYL